jgi:hypothetical protein
MLKPLLATGRIEGKEIPSCENQPKYSMQNLTSNIQNYYEKNKIEKK